MYKNKDEKNKNWFQDTRVSCKDLAKDFADNTTAHGPNRISGARNIYFRIFWIILFSALAGYTIYNIAEQILYYYEWPVSTIIQITNEPRQIFPAVTVCNQNRIKSSLLSNSAKYHTLPDIDKTMCACNYVSGTHHGCGKN